MKILPSLTMSCLFLLTFGNLYSQKLAIKAGPMMTYFQNETQWVGGINSFEQLYATWAVPAVVVNGRWKLVHQFSLEDSHLSLNDRSERDNSGDFTAGELSLNIQAHVRYQAIRLLLPDHRKLRPYLGLSTDLVLSSGMIDPYTSNRFRNRNTIADLVFGMLAGLRLNLSESVFLDADLGYAPFEIEYLWQEVDNPNLPIQQQHAAGFNALWFTRARGSVGVGLWIR